MTEDVLFNPYAKRYGRWRPMAGIPQSYLAHKAALHALRVRHAWERQQRLVATSAAEWLADRGDTVRVVR